MYMYMFEIQYNIHERKELIIVKKISVFQFSLYNIVTIPLNVSSDGSREIAHLPISL